MRALVISGGGSKGAYAGGVAEYLIEVQKHKYDLYVGTSTGSLLLSHLALGNTKKLYELYTNVTQKSIFSVNPLKVKKKGSKLWVDINYPVTIRQFLKKKPTFGESDHLKDLIYGNFSPEDFKKLQQAGIDIVVTVSNLTKATIEYKSIQDCTYEEFCDWVWISCNYVPFMSLAERNGCEYADGGFGMIIPIREAIRRGATTVDVIVLKASSVDRQVFGKNPFSLLMNLFRFMLVQIERSNLVEGDILAKSNNVKINYYYSPDELTRNSLIFNKKVMAKWWQQGFDYAAEKAKEATTKENIDSEKI